MPISISVQHLTRTYGDFTAVDDLSFDVGPSEIVGIIGPNGAGKTTTLRSLAGILRPTSGTASIDGHDIVADALEAKRRLAFISDEPHLFEYLTVEEHLRLVARLYRVDDLERRARTLIEELELSGKERSLPGELSRGMRQKVVIACGLVRYPAVLLFDEPLTGLGASLYLIICSAKGQRLVTFAGVLFGLIVMVAPAALAAGLVWLAFYRLIGMLAPPVAAAVFAVLVLIEVLVVIEALGPVYERLDLTGSKGAE